MIIVLGLVVLIAAVVVAVAGVFGNHGLAHALVHPFTMLGYHVTGSEGRLFFYGIVVGAVGVAALGLLLAGARRTSRRGSEARRSLRQSRQETAAVSRDRDDLLDQRETARAYSASTLDNNNNAADGQVMDAPTDIPAP
jgi:gas vesicle protein